MQELLSRLSKVRMFMSRYGGKIGQSEGIQISHLCSSPWHTLTETKCGKAVQPDEFDMKVPHRLRMSIQRPDHLE
jgi:hypothetical protein